MNTIYFVALVVGIVLVFGNWFLRTRPFWDDKTKYSDKAYNNMWTVTGILVGLGIASLAVAAFGIINSLI